MSKIHFISGLPRSGSTLLSSILRQNPIFNAGMSSPLFGIVGAAQLGLSTKNEFHMLMDEEVKLRILRGIFENFHSESISSGVAFDTHRLWTNKASLIRRLYPDAKIICCVRNLSSIVASLEKVHLNSLSPSKINDFMSNDSVYQRYQKWTSPTGIIGKSYNAMRGAISSNVADSIIIVRYEDLVRSPSGTIGRIYDLIGVPRFAHDFEDLAYQEPAFDKSIGLEGLHNVRRTIKNISEDAYLPQEIMQAADKGNFWND